MLLLHLLREENKEGLFILLDYDLFSPSNRYLIAISRASRTLQ